MLQTSFYHPGLSQTRPVPLMRVLESSPIFNQKEGVPEHEGGKKSVHSKTVI